MPAAIDYLWFDSPLINRRTSVIEFQNQPFVINPTDEIHVEGDTANFTFSIYGEEIT